MNDYGGTLDMGSNIQIYLSRGTGDTHATKLSYGATCKTP